MAKLKALFIGYFDFIVKKSKVINDENTKDIEDNRFDIILSDNLDYIKDTDTIIKDLERKYKVGTAIIDKDSISFELALKIERLRSPYTYKERIAVTINPHIDKTQNIYCNLLNMNTVLNDLVLLGTGLMKSDIPKLVNVIQQNYRSLNSIEDTNEDILEAKFKDIVAMFNDVIDKAETTSGFFSIPVNEFKEYIDTSEYDKFGTSAIRQILKDKKLTICNTNRTDYTEKKINGTTGKFIKFDVNAVKDYNIKITKTDSKQ